MNGCFGADELLGFCRSEPVRKCLQDGLERNPLKEALTQIMSARLDGNTHGLWTLTGFCRQMAVRKSPQVDDLNCSIARDVLKLLHSSTRISISKLHR